MSELPAIEPRPGGRKSRAHSPTRHDEPPPGDVHNWYTDLACVTPFRKGVLLIRTMNNAKQCLGATRYFGGSYRRFSERVAVDMTDLTLSEGLNRRYTTLYRVI